MNPGAKRLIRLIGAVSALGLIAIQFIPVDRSTPSTGSSAMQAPAEVHSILVRACYDCHSNETKWPWYSRIAPISWLVAHDVKDGREALNFSRWGELEESKRAHMLEEAWEEIEEGEMPPWFYQAPHREAWLTTEDKAALRNWALAGARRSTTPGDEDDD